MDDSANDSASRRSPEWVRLSTAAAITLGLRPGLMHGTDCTHCLNLLLTYPEGCRANCAYCGLARHRRGIAYAGRNFIRVDWPMVRYGEIIERMQTGGDKGRFERMCLSMITHPDSERDTLSLLDTWVRTLPQVPVSILSNPSTMRRDDLRRLKEAGAEIFTVALDAATPALFHALRGDAVRGPHAWERYWRVLDWAGEIYGPGRFGVHLICGLGETEREMLELIQRIHDRGGNSHLFAFHPERGSQLEDRPPCLHGHWRRVQLGRYLVQHRGVRAEAMAFDAHGRVRDFGCGKPVLDEVLASGKPFRTSGCAGRGDPEIAACDRPYGDCRPSDIMSFPFPLAEKDRAAVANQLDGIE